MCVLQVCRQHDGTSASLVIFNEIDSSVYKRWRLHQLTLPLKFLKLVRHLGLPHMTTLHFTEEVLRLLKDLLHVYFASAAQVDLKTTAECRLHADKAFLDGIFFTTVPRLFTVFVSVECYIFPVFFRLMTGKARSLTSKFSRNCTS